MSNHDSETENHIAELIRTADAGDVFVIYYWRNKKRKV